jgi:hypothetical protein
VVNTNLSRGPSAALAPNQVTSNNKDDNPSTGACPRPLQPHPGLFIKGQRKSKYKSGDLIIYQCHTKLTVTAICLSDGTWSRGPPHCPPSEESCPVIGKISHGQSEVIKSEGASIDSPPFSIGTKVRFHCAQGYELKGPSIVFCEPGHIWSYKAPICTFKKDDIPRSNATTTLAILLTSISIIFLLTVLLILLLVYRWRKRKLQRKRWQRYFGNFNHRQSKTNITASPTHETHDMKLVIIKNANKEPAVPVTDL